MHSAPPPTGFPFARLLGMLLAGCLALSAVAALILFNVQQRAFDPATYEGALTDASFYQQFPGLLASLVQQNLGAHEPAFLQRITPEQWNTVMITLLPPQELKAMVEDAIAQTFGFLNGEVSEPSVSLAPLKQSLAGPSGIDAALYVLHAQPACTVEQAAAMLKSLGNEICDPPQKLLDLLRPYLQSELQNVAAGLPDRVAMVGGTPNPGLQSALEEIRIARMLMRFSPLLPILFLLALTAIVVRTLKGWLAWWGWSLLLAGLIGVPSSLLASPALAWLFERSLLTPVSPALPTDVASAVRSIVEATLREVLRPVVWQSAAILATGAVMVVASSFVRGPAATDLADTRPRVPVS